MTPDAVFQFANTLVLPHWLLMVVAPRWRPTQWLAKYLPIPVVLALLYIYYLFFGGESSLDFQSFNSLQGVKSLFKADTAVLAGWIHYLAFDLVVGSWILRSSQKRKINHWLIIPCLFFCFMLGPVGFLLYWIIRQISTQPSSRETDLDD